jgi:CRISPR system Cascade subunit CasE
MNISRVLLDMRSGPVRKDISDPYAMHATLMRASAGERILWRYEPSDTRIQSILVAHEQHLNYDHVRERYPDYLASVQTRPLRTENVKAGAVYRFRLTGNPTVTRGGKRYALSGPADQLLWLSRQGSRCGFSVLGALVSEDVFRKGRRHNDDSGRIAFRSVVFDGHLRVDDLPAFHEALRLGIGHGKAFGCGMLTLAGL